MQKILSTSVAIILIAVIGCKDDPSERAKTGPASQETSKPKTNEDENADMPVQITGAFLTTEFVPALADKADDETTLGGRVEKDGATVDLAAFTVTGKVVDATTGALIQEFSLADGSEGNQFSVNVKNTVIAGAKISIRVTNSASQSGTLSRNIADHAGKILASMSPDKLFDVANTTDVNQPLTAKNYCNASGPLDVVSKTAGGTGITVPIATMSSPPTVNLAEGDVCFARLSSFTGTTTKSLLGPSERIGDFIGSGLANGGSINCMFVAVHPKSATGDVKPHLYIFKDNSPGFLADMRKTAFEKRCP